MHFRFVASIAVVSAVCLSPGASAGDAPPSPGPLAWSLPMTMPVPILAPVMPSLPAYDPIQAIRMLFLQVLMAADAGDARAQTQMGWIAEHGLMGMTRDLAEAVRWYERAASQNDPIGLYNLAQMFLKGQGVAPDPEKAALLLTGAADLNLAAAQAELARMYEQGVGVSRDPAAAAELLRRAAELGDVSAQGRLGVKYLQGEGVAADAAEAVKWLTRAAEAGDAEAQDHLGRIYLDAPEGIERDVLAGANWLALAGGQGHVGAQKRLAAMFEQGRDLPGSLVEAARWYGLAAAAGDAEAIEGLRRINEQVSSAFGKN